MWQTQYELKTKIRPTTSVQVGKIDKQNKESQY